MKYYTHTLPTGQKVEAIDIIEHMGLDFNQGNVIKYIARAGKKSTDSLHDITKAYYYAKRSLYNIMQPKTRPCTRWRVLDIVTAYCSFDESAHAAQYVLYDTLTQNLCHESLKELRDYLHQMYDHAVVTAGEGLHVMIEEIDKKHDMCNVVGLADPDLVHFEVSLHEVSSPIKYVYNVSEEECCEEFYNAYRVAGN